jgi:hypothetical protein
MLACDTDICYSRKKLKRLNICDMQIQSTTELFDLGVMKLARYPNLKRLAR